MLSQFKCRRQPVPCVPAIFASREIGTAASYRLCLEVLTVEKITLIKIQGCPYCASAFKAIDELKKIFPSTTIDVVDENLEPSRAEKFTDYYYVPTMYVDGEKIYEAHPGENYEECFANVKKVFEVAQ